MNDAVAGRIFVGGVGRSGTTIAARVLGSHPEIYQVPVESRILIDPKGLLPLIDAFSTRFSSAAANNALHDFREFALCDLASPLEPPYRGRSLGERLGLAHYRETIEQFLDDLHNGTYPSESAFWTEPAAITRGRNAARAWAGVRTGALHRHPRRLASRWRHPYPRRDHQFAVRYFRRGEINAIAARFVDDLFGFPMRQHGRHIWCEKTPQNLLFLEQLEELCPGSVHVHMKRDPRAVVWSRAHQAWEASDLRLAALSTRAIYQAWLDRDFRPQHFFEIKLEDFGQDPRTALEPVADALGIAPDFDAASTVSTSKVDHWEAEMTREQRSAVEEILGDVLGAMGY